MIQKIKQAANSLIKKRAERIGPGTPAKKIDGYDLNDGIKIVVLVMGCEFIIESISYLKELNIPFVTNAAVAGLAMVAFLARQWLADNSNIVYKPKNKNQG